MAVPSFSPATSISSHTLSAQSAQPPPMDPQMSSTPMLLSSLSIAPHTFLQPPRNLHTAALALAKQYLDPLASGVSEAQIQRQKDARKKRKRGERHYEDTRVLHLKKVHLDGFGVDQVWEQARRVLDAARGEVEKALPDIQDEEDEEDVEDTDVRGNGRKAVHFDEDGFELSGSEDENPGQLGEKDVEWEVGSDDLSRKEFSDEERSEEEGFEEEGSGEEDSEDEGSEADIPENDEDIEMEDGDFDDDLSQVDEPTEAYVPDPHGLNDGFFSIDDFNKQSEFLEQQDERGEPAASDDEEIDWDADPLAMGAGALAGDELDDDASEEDDEEGGPTFGNVDLNAPEGDSEDDEPLEDGDLDDMGGMTNTNNIMYADFFAPPARKASKNKKKRGRPNPHNFPGASDPQNTTMAPEEEDIQRTISAVHRDLFGDSDGSDLDGDLSELDPADPKSRRSTHERRQAKLAEEIRQLEAANVAKRDWTLSGEARAADRPINSLLEEDLDFERVGKPVPVITVETSEDIEALIKRRIIAGEFDEVRRRRPDDLVSGPSERRGRFELDDTKSSKGLAELYEEEHLRATDPNFVDAKDEKLKKEHAEIEALWKDVSGKLDALSSWHYRPKPAAPTLEVRVDAPAIEMEDARPSVGGEVAGASMLAPQEVYKPGEEKNRTEVITKGGMPVAREEMTREQKLRRRRREKERIKKAGTNKNGKYSDQSKKAKENNIVGDLKRGGVRVIGKKGEITDVEGREVKDKKRVSGGHFKL
ncbi:Mpp10 protein [Lepidopterella palustris CBS 459.81]|uniref:U3 small nucleolar ribonucleoprotein protein MPP10 n=1 Tax=Lepidopterella palustris CBS 459.81 TaxID=1314670 RepID=A0A8E2EBU4_9PEZI|nr:Mpp10 protein [Lepidopterella palustris CBS 459.81]